MAKYKISFGGDANQEWSVMAKKRVVFCIRGGETKEINDTDREFRGVIKDIKNAIKDTKGLLKIQEGGE